LSQDFFADGCDLVDVAEKVDDVLRAGEQGQVAQDDDTIETVVSKASRLPNSFAKVSIGPLL